MKMTPSDCLELRPYLNSGCFTFVKELAVSDFFIGEIRVFPFNWAPKGWALCDGATLPVTQNAALGALLGTQFGGDGKTTFGLPDLRGRVPLCTGSSSTYGNYIQGVQGAGGVEGVTLTTAQVPAHTHSFRAVSAPGSATTPAAGSFVSSVKPAVTTSQIYGATTATPSPTLAPLNSGTLTAAGGLPHKNMQPYLVMNFCISTVGIFPSRP